MSFRALIMTYSGRSMKAKIRRDCAAMYDLEFISMFF
jgi:hypothetical protein